MLEIKNVYKTFNAGTVNEKVALQDLNLTLEDGDFVTVIGGNGAGKSTMLNAVAGVWPIDMGKILIDGQDVTRLSEHQRAKYIGRVFQDPMMGTAATMGIEENLALAARRGVTRSLKVGITKKEREEYHELLKTLDLGLEDRMTSKVGLLSGGQRQAVTLLMATLKKPKLLLLDEHTAALDPKTAAKVLALSEKIVQENHLTTLMITHNMKDAIKYGNRLSWGTAARTRPTTSCCCCRSRWLPHRRWRRLRCVQTLPEAKPLPRARILPPARDEIRGPAGLGRLGHSGWTRPTTSCCCRSRWLPHRRWGGACAVQAFCRRQNLAAGGIHFRPRGMKSGVPGRPGPAGAQRFRRGRRQAAAVLKAVKSKQSAPPSTDGGALCLRRKNPRNSSAGVQVRAAASSRVVTAAGSISSRGSHSRLMVLPSSPFWLRASSQTESLAQPE